LIRRRVSVIATLFRGFVIPLLTQNEQYKNRQVPLRKRGNKSFASRRDAMLIKFIN
jgi:hypothetical protein